jgi:hypothetical protein
MKLITAGSRDFIDYDLFKKDVAKIIGDNTDVTIVSGMARGADAMGVKYANDNNLTLKKFPADWDRYGKSAGYKRNEEMAAYADTCICFWDGKSKGTGHMIDLAKRYGLKVEIVKY